MSPMATSWIVLACVFGGALLGMLLRVVLPEHHQSTDSKHVLELLLGLIGTMAALVLGLLVATAESSYTTRCTEFTQMSANFILLDRALALYEGNPRSTPAFGRPYCPSDSARKRYAREVRPCRCLARNSLY